MCDNMFDLSQALESSSNSDNRPKEFDMKHCPREAKGVGLPEEKHLHAEEFCKTSIRQVATLVMALHRMKCKHMPQSSEFTDNQLYSIIMENLVEDESVVVKVEDRKVHAGREATYIQMRGVTECCLRDRYQKDMVHFSGALELQAITLQGGSREQRVKFKLSTYLSAQATRGKVIALTIANTNWNLSCRGKKDSPTLHLEVFNEKQLKEIKAENDLVRFLFRKWTADMDTYESVKYRGWYISTSLEEHQPVGMCQKGTANRLTHFKD